MFRFLGEWIDEWIELTNEFGPHQAAYLFLHARTGTFLSLQL